MTYRDNVERMASVLTQADAAQRVADDFYWEAARLTFENTRNSRWETEGVTMEQWCTDVSQMRGRPFSTSSGTKYKRAWTEYGQHLDAVDRPAWADVFNAILGSTGSERIIGSGTKVLLSEGSPKKKREVFQQLARDPDVIEEAAMLGTPTSRAVSDLYTKTERVREEWAERETASDPISKRLDEVGAALDLEAACNRFARDLVAMSERFAREINEALPRTGPAREEHLYWVRQALERARSVLNELESYAETGRTDLDAFLEGVLGGR